MWMAQPLKGRMLCRQSAGKWNHKFTSRCRMQISAGNVKLCEAMHNNTMLNILHIKHATLSPKIRQV